MPVEAATVFEKCINEKALVLSGKVSVTCIRRRWSHIGQRLSMIGICDPCCSRHGDVGGMVRLRAVELLSVGYTT